MPTKVLRVNKLLVNPLSRVPTTRASSAHNFVEAKSSGKVVLMFLSDCHIQDNAFDTPLLGSIIRRIRKHKKDGFSVVTILLGDLVNQENQRLDPDEDSSRIRRMRRSCDSFFQNLLNEGAKILFSLRGNEDSGFENNYGFDPYSFLISRGTHVFNNSCDFVLRHSDNVYTFCLYHILSYGVKKHGVHTRTSVKTIFENIGVIDGRPPDFIIQGHLHSAAVQTLENNMRNSTQVSQSHPKYFINCPSLLNTMNYGHSSYATKLGLLPISSGFLEIKLDNDGIYNPVLLNRAKLEKGRYNA